VCKPGVFKFQWGCSHPQSYGFHHTRITHGASPPIPVKKLQNTVSPIFFLWGDISRDKEINFLLHITHRQRCKFKSREYIMLYAYL